MKPNYTYFPVVFEEKVFGTSRNEAFAALELQEIHARKYFYLLTNSFDCSHGRYDSNQAPIALHISKRVLTLPIYADMVLEAVDRFSEIILGYKGKD